MYKIFSNSYDFGESSTQLLFSKDVPLIKSASNKTRLFIKDVIPEKGYTYLLLLAMGAGEYYGCNKNGDYFSEVDLKNKHSTFVTHGKVFKHHKNKSTDKSYGEVVFSNYNEDMKRVELVVKVIDSECPDIISKVKNDQDIPVSMSCRLKFDICSICNNKARSTVEYCDHLKNQMGDILPNGKQVYAINPDPTFFDISFVWRPADRIAYVLEKVASSSEGYISSAVLAEQEGLIDNDYKFEKLSSSKRALLDKLADIEKEIVSLGSDAENVPDREKKYDVVFNSITPDELEELEGFVKDKDIDFPCIANNLGREGIFLNFPDFIKKFLGNNISGDFMDDLKGTDLSSIFSDLSKGEDDFDLSEDIFGLNEPFKKINFPLDLIGKKSLRDFPGGNRGVSISIKMTPSTKIKKFPGGVATSSSSGGINVLSNEKKSNLNLVNDLKNLYGKYKLDILEKYSGDDNFFKLAAVVHNFKNF